MLLLSGAITDVSALQQQAAAGNYQELVELFTEWREFQRPKLRDGVPDYSAAAMAAQHRALPALQRRLADIDTAGWSRAQQVDWHIVRAEMNGLDFDHRVLRPWANNPAFYVTVFSGRSDQPAREGPHADGALELWSYSMPLSAGDAAAVAARLRIIPGLLAQARENLVGDGKDLWTMGIRSIAEQSSALESLAARVARHDELAAEVTRARQATDELRVWLESQTPSKTGPSGIGIDRYDWYLKNVQLVPYTWQDQVTLMRRELGRARAALALEEQKNRKLPPHRLIADSAEWSREFDAAVTEYMAFLEERSVLTVRAYMEPALRARRGRFSAGAREFFTEVNYRDAIVMRTHDFHWIDLAQMEVAPHASPIRRGPLLYNIFITRTEGLATAMEELLTHAGLLDEHPRGRELIYVLVAQRAARALGDLMMHANQFTIEDAVAFTSAQTPRNWLKREGRTVWGEQHLYLQQPAYGTSYLIGKQDIERLLSDRAQQLGTEFSLKRFMDELTAVGMMPMSLVRYELLGELEIH
jgi:uncharacterized protein (DUF885 family)